MHYSNDFIKEIPKSDLHLHLDGSIRLSSLLEMAKVSKLELPSNTEAGMSELVFKDTYASLPEYLTGFKYTCGVLRDLENIERAAYELAVDNQEDGVRYIEVRFAPQLLTNSALGITLEKVLQATADGLERAKKEFNKTITSDEPHFDYGIICCVMRMFGPENFSPYYTNLFSVMKYSKASQVISLAALELVRAAVKIRDQKGIPIVGIDLAGQEEGYPADNFKDAYEYAHKNFLSRTVHAGEAYGAESIFQAITECHADRIGHGYSLFMPERIVDPLILNKKKYIKDLASYIADRRTTIEVCLTSNLQTNPEIKSIKDHKFKNMLESRIATTICTDNRLFSKTSVSKEYRLAVDNFDIPLKRLKDIVAYGFKKSFYLGGYVEKRDYAKKAMNYFDEIAKKHNITE
jgi:adenosine deaminase